MKKNKFNISNKPSEIAKFRAKHLKDGFELVDITQLCEFKLGNSGWCNDINEPEENIYHIQVYYRGEEIVVVGIKGYVIDEDRYALFVTEDSAIADWDKDFIIFRKIPVMTDLEY